MDTMLQLFLDATSEGLIKVDFTARTAEYSARWRAMFGFDARAGEQWHGAPEFWRSLVHPGDQEELEMCWREHLDDVWPFEHQCRLRFDGGGYRWVSIRSILQRDGTTPSKALILFTDVTERVESEQRQLALLEAIPDSMLRLRADGSVSAWHAGSSGVLPLPAMINPGAQLASVAQDERFVREVEQCAAEARRLGEPVEREWLSRATGSSTCLDLRVVPSGSDEVVCILRDVSEKKKLEMQILQSQKLESIGSLAAGVAHEINTPTQFIGDNLTFLERGWGQLEGYLQAVDTLLATLPADAAQPVRALAKRARLDYLRKQAPSAIAQSLEGTTRISSIVGAMKSFSHPGDDIALASLNDAVRTTATVARSEWRHVADVTFELDEALEPVECALGGLNQVFLNILVNAAHAIGDHHAAAGTKGVIVIRSRGEAEHAVIEIQDDGGGIPESLRARIFDPFFTTKAVGRGTGQGLAIARSVVVDNHGGELEVDSTEGVGTTFRIRLPYAHSVARDRPSGVCEAAAVAPALGAMIG